MTAGTRFEAIYNAHAAEVHRYALRRLDRSRAEDVVAEVFVVAWRRIEDVPAEPRGWLLGVARRVVANARRAEQRRASLEKRLAVNLTVAEGRTDSPHRLADALLALSETDREALTLIAWDGLSQREAAQALGVREGTFAVRLFRARRRLQRSLTAPPPTTKSTATPQEAR